MISRSKLRGPVGRIGPYAVAVFLSAGLIEGIITTKPLYSAIAFGLFFIIIGILEFLRTKLVTYLILGLLWGTGTWHSLVQFVDSFLSLKTYFAHVIISFGALILAWSVFYGHEKLESNARRLFNLAAEHVHEAFNGYTGRPYSACKIDYTKDEIRGFARFMGGKNIAKSIMQENVVILAFSMGISPLKQPELQQVSYVSFDNEGNISVHISEYDYTRFKEELTFDQLCASLGDVFKRFLEYYKTGLEARIINELKSGVK